MRLSSLPALVLPLALFLQACDEAPTHYPGYVEGEYLHMAVPASGQLMRMPVERGGKVSKGDLLFEVERDREQAALEETAHRLEQAIAEYSNLTKGKRPEEIAVIQAQLSQARADAELAASRLKRSRELFRTESISRDRLDEDSTRYESARARVQELQASLAAAGLAARADEIAAAEQTVKAAEAAVAQARWAYEQKAPAAPADALVQDSYFQVGEWVTAGTPVLSLLPAENRLVRFFVPETVVATLQPGQQVQINCDACGGPVPAQIDFIATEAEYTPPVIYSRDQRAKLVFRVEARPRPADAGRLPPGLPVDVRIPNS